MSGHIASASNVSWNTRPDHIKLVKAVFGGQIELDPCWNPGSYTDPLWCCDLAQQSDGLEAPWNQIAKNAFVNPPFGVCYYNPATGMVLPPKKFNGHKQSGTPPYAGTDRDMFRKSNVYDWILKCANEAAAGVEVIAHIPAAVDTAHWQEIIYPTSQANCMIKGRVRFYWGGQQGGPAPMACAFVYWGKNPAVFETEFKKIGVVKF